MTAANWFDVDKEGLRQMLGDRGVRFAVLELIQNSLDANGVTRVDVLVEPAGHGHWKLTVRDDAPGGFERLELAWTLFAATTKRVDPEKRGRFTVGEKLVFALCSRAKVVSTTGGVEFGPKGRRRLSEKRAAGTLVECVLPVTRQDADALIGAARSVLPPRDVVVTVNNEPVQPRDVKHTFRARLATVVQRSDGQLARVRRETSVELLQPQEGEAPTLFELGIPVVELDGGEPWHVSIGQRVPLNMDRDNVTPGFLRELRVAVLNHTHEQLREQDAPETWVREAVSDARTSDEAVRDALRMRFGEGAVARDPSDQEANCKAFAYGRNVVSGASLTADEWAQARRADALPPAGRIYPSKGASVAAERFYTDEDVTPGMRAVAALACELANAAIGGEISVVFMEAAKATVLAQYGSRVLTFNVARLGRGWFDDPYAEKVIALIIHELGHENGGGNHLSVQYHDALCAIGARLLRSAKAWP